MNALEHLLARSLSGLVRANGNLAKIKNGKTLYEIQPSHDQDSFNAWTALNEAVRQANLALASCKIETDPDVDDSAGPEITS